MHYFVSIYSFLIENGHCETCYTGDELMHFKPEGEIETGHKRQKGA